MQVNIKIKPMKFESTTKGSVISKIVGQHVLTISKHGTGYQTIGGSTSDTIRVYNLEKRRKVVERTLVKGKRSTKIIKRAHWIAFVYDFPMSLLKCGNMKVVQGGRTFKLVQAS